MATGLEARTEARTEAAAEGMDAITAVVLATMPVTVLSWEEAVADEWNETQNDSSLIR